RDPNKMFKVKAGEGLLNLFQHEWFIWTVLIIGLVIFFYFKLKEKMSKREERKEVKKMLDDGLREALKKIGMSDEEIMKRSEKKGISKTYKKESFQSK
ncbi:unnamed protein product, partial [marine sediment metagenome]